MIFLHPKTRPSIKNYRVFFIKKNLEVFMINQILISNSWRMSEPIVRKLLRDVNDLLIVSDNFKPEDISQINLLKNKLRKRLTILQK